MCENVCGSTILSFICHEACNCLPTTMDDFAMLVELGALNRVLMTINDSFIYVLKK
jgi:hypothetical protein